MRWSHIYAEFEKEQNVMTDEFIFQHQFLGGALLLHGSDEAQTESLNLRGDLWPNRKPYSSMIAWLNSDWNSIELILHFTNFSLE